MNIAMIHFRVGETDGVSLEMDKWKHELECLGHKVYYIAGNAYNHQTFVIDELAYDNPYDLNICYHAFESLAPYTDETLKYDILKLAETIKHKMSTLFKKLNIELIIPNNHFALARSIPIALGLYLAIQELGIRAIGHHHDFYWERIKYANPTSPFIKESLNHLFPPRMKNMKHVVINSSAQIDLLKRKNLESKIVPNVFDFDQPLWRKDDYNADFLSSYQLTDQDIVFLQATRVVNRKAIELTIDLISHMNQSKEQWYGKMLYDGRVFSQNCHFTLLCVGLHEGTDSYESKLISYAQGKNVKLILNPSKVSHTRSFIEEKKYALWDAYVFADVISYPSIYEGFGNQFLEALFAKKPMIIFEYPVFLKDIKAHGFEYASLGDAYEIDKQGLVHVPQSTLNHASQAVYSYLFDKEDRQRICEHNFMLGKRHYGLETLRTLLEQIIEKVEL